MESSTNALGKKAGGSFMRSVAVLAGGAAAAHAITALAMPVLSRLYSPADFSALAVFTSLLSIIGVAAGLRFDIAVPIAGSDVEAVNLLGLSMVSAAVVALVLAIPVFWVPGTIAALLNQPKLAGSLWMLPLAVFLAVCYSALQGWFVRRNAFAVLARTRIAQSSTSSAAQIATGLASLAPFGLLLGSLLNAGAACLSLGARWVWKERSLLTQVNTSALKRVAMQYHRFPKYSTLEAMGNTAANQLPILMIASMAAGPEAGYLAMAMYAMQAPMALIGTAIGQVFLSRAPVAYSEGKLSSFTAEIFGGLLKAGVGPLLFAGIVSPVAFTVVFGEEWRRAGNLVAWMTPWFILQFIASPISMALHVVGKQRTALILQIVSLCTRVSLVWVAGTINVNWISEAFAISGFLIYFLYCWVIFKALSITAVQVMPYAAKAAKYGGFWIVAGLAVRLLFDVALPLIHAI